jgi:hypothetical protein
MTTYSISFASDGTAALAGLGSKDGHGCGDHDEPYRFGRRPRANAPFPFTPYQYARVLALRGCIGDGLRAQDDLDAAARPTRPDEPSYDPNLAARDVAARDILHAAGVLDES